MPLFWSDVLGTDVSLKENLCNDVNANVSAECPCGLHTLQRYLTKPDNKLEARDMLGNTVLHHASFHNSPMVLEWVLGVDDSFKNAQNNYGETPLYQAARKGRKECLGILLRFGCNRDIPDKYGESPIQIAKKKSERAFIGAAKKEMFLQVIAILQGTASPDKVQEEGKSGLFGSFLKKKKKKGKDNNIARDNKMEEQRAEEKVNHANNANNANNENLDDTTATNIVDGDRYVKDADNKNSNGSMKDRPLPGLPYNPQDAKVLRKQPSETVDHYEDNYKSMPEYEVCVYEICKPESDLNKRIGSQKYLEPNDIIDDVQRADNVEEEDYVFTEESKLDENDYENFKSQLKNDDRNPNCVDEKRRVTPIPAPRTQESFSDALPTPPRNKPTPVPRPRPSLDIK